MTLIRIDETRCKKDGFCVQVCPAAIIKQTDEESVPEMISQGALSCLRCGHCVAVCPHDALHHENIPMEHSPRIQKALTITKAQASQFLRTRRSIRRYKNKPVDKETIQSLIDAARYAPTGGNSQLVTWTVHTDKAKLKNMADLTIAWMKAVLASDEGKQMPPYFPRFVEAYDAGRNTVTHNAPCLVVASAPGYYANGMVDLSIALSYFELMAVAVGMGTCWMGLISRALKMSEPLKQAIGLPESHTNFFPMVLGYPKFTYRRLPERKPATIFWK